MIIPQFGLSQTINKRSNNILSEEEPSWKPINEFPNYQNMMQTSPNDVGTPTLINVMNGVAFFRKVSDCNSEKIILLKLINSNNYPVKVSWQISPTTPVKSVVVPALFEMEGSCSIIDSNQTNLATQIPAGIDNEEMKKYALSHLTVIEEKNN